MRRFCYSIVLFVAVNFCIATVYGQTSNNRAVPILETCQTYSFESFAVQQNQPDFWKGWGYVVQNNKSIKAWVLAQGEPVSETQVINTVREVCEMYTRRSNASNFVNMLRQIGRDLPADRSGDRPEAIPELARTLPSNNSEPVEISDSIQTEENNAVVPEPPRRQLSSNTATDREPPALENSGNQLEDRPSSDIQDQAARAPIVQLIPPENAQLEATAPSNSENDVRVVETIRSFSGASALPQAIEDAESSPSNIGENSNAQDQNRQTSGPNSTNADVFYQISAKDINTIEERKLLDDENAESLKSVEGISYFSKRLMWQALKSLKLPSDKLAAIVQITEKKYTSVKPKGKNKVPLAQNCGCSEIIDIYPTNLSQKQIPMLVSKEDQNPQRVVYAFFPVNPALWRGQIQPQIDFELVDRVAIDRRRIDSTGNFVINENWDTENIDKYIRSAHKHRAKIDVAIEVPDIDKWSDEFIGIATSNIANTVVPDEKKRPRFDGVTLIIPGYNGLDNGSSTIVSEKISSLVKSIRFALQSEPISINMAFDIDFTSDIELKINEKQLSSKNLFNYSEELEEDQLNGIGKLFVKSSLQVTDGEAINSKKSNIKSDVDKILIFLQRPTSDAKKILRARIESSFKGANRAIVQRKIIPIIPNDGHKNLGTKNRLAPNSYAQFVDDLIYFDDNFGGVGFWPAPVVQGNDEYNEIRDKTREQFDRNYNRNPTLDALCRFACPNRVLVTSTAGGLLATTLALIFLSNYSLLSYRISYKFWAVPLLTLAAIGLLTALYICDKQAPWTFTAIIAITLAMVFAFLLSWHYGKVAGPNP